MRRCPSLFLVALTSLSATLLAGTAHADGPNVVASIKPIHSLVAGVMGDTGSPHLLVSGADSPHTYSMRPSDAEALSNADVVFWVGDELETFLERPIENLGGDARTVALIEAPGMTLMDFPGAGDHDEHDHEAHDDDHDHEHDGDHADEEHEHEEDHAHEDEHLDGDEHGHHHTGLDPHVWLDPENAKAMVAEIVAVLSEADSENADTYKSNGAALTARLEKLEADTESMLAPYRTVPYFTFHESFNYFNERFGLDSHGAISISPERQPGAQRLTEIRSELKAFDHACVFSEPQFPPKLVGVIVEGTNAKTGTLDPLGANLEPGADLYVDLIKQNRKSFATCFKAAK